ncbi:hypothetical protein [Streptomyces sp. NPDC087300]|uniref:hypothetical protein n=1 Tax=Streptomyces sp. NPDC087300 TaxID=3365780 RepID=UPI00380CEC80
MRETLPHAVPCTPGPHRAEVMEIRPGDGQILLRMSLTGTEAEQADLVLEIRGGGTELRLPARGFGTRFEVGIPLRPLAARPGIECAGIPGVAREWIWDLHLSPDAGGDRLRLGRHFGGARGRKASYAYPPQRAEDVWVKPYFTVGENLSIRCHPRFRRATALRAVGRAASDPTRRKVEPWQARSPEADPNDAAPASWRARSWPPCGPPTRL